MLKQIYGRMGDNFDLRRWLDGIDKRVDACIKGFNEDPSIFYGFRILPLNPADRDFLMTTLGSTINETCPNTVVFGLLIAHRQLIVLVRMKKLTLFPSDFNIIVNIIECHRANLIEGETWVPICLPQFNQNSFLHAHISYLWEGTGPCLILLSTSKEAFFDLSKVRPKVEDHISLYKRHEQLKMSLSHPDAFSLDKQISCPQLWHFMYKNILSLQICCSSPQKPFIAYDELLALYQGYLRLSDVLRKGDMKMLFSTMEDYSLFSWVTSSFELHCTLSPLITQAVAMETAEKMLKILRKEEKRIFITSNSGLLVG